MDIDSSPPTPPSLIPPPLSNAFHSLNPSLPPLPFRVHFLITLGIAAWATNLHLLNSLGIDTAVVLDIRGNRWNNTSNDRSNDDDDEHDYSRGTVTHPTNSNTNPRRRLISAGGSLLPPSLPPHISSNSLPFPTYHLALTSFIWCLTTYFIWKLGRSIALNDEIDPEDKDRVEFGETKWDAVPAVGLFTFLTAVVMLPYHHHHPRNTSSGYSHDPISSSSSPLSSLFFRLRSPFHLLSTFISRLSSHFPPSIRQPFLSSLLRTSLPSLNQSIPFSDVILGDMLTSFARVLADAGRVGVEGWWIGWGRGGDRDGDGVGTEWMGPVLTGLPYLFRLRQCLSEFNTSTSPTTSRRSLLNALKYASSFPVIILSAWLRGPEDNPAHDERLENGGGGGGEEVNKHLRHPGGMVWDDELGSRGGGGGGSDDGTSMPTTISTSRYALFGASALFQLWILAVFINSLYSFWWDVTNDWGLELFVPKRERTSSTTTTTTTTRSMGGRRKTGWMGGKMDWAFSPLSPFVNKPGGGGGGFRIPWKKVSPSPTPDGIPTSPVRENLGGGGNGGSRRRAVSNVNNNNNNNNNGGLNVDLRGLEEGGGEGIGVGKGKEKESEESDEGVVVMPVGRTTTVSEGNKASTGGLLMTRNDDFFSPMHHRRTPSSASQQKTNHDRLLHRDFESSGASGLVNSKMTTTSGGGGGGTTTKPSLYRSNSSIEDRRLLNQPGGLNNPSRGFSNPLPGGGGGGRPASSSSPPRRSIRLAPPSLQNKSLDYPYDSSSYPSHLNHRRRQTYSTLPLPPSSTSPNLRPTLLLPDPTIYYLLIILDLILRFTWSLKLSSHLHRVYEIEGGIFLMEGLEVLRRWMWVFGRVEWEAVKKGATPTNTGVTTGVGNQQYDDDLSYGVDDGEDGLPISMTEISNSNSNSRQQAAAPLRRLTVPQSLKIEGIVAEPGSGPNSSASNVTPMMVHGHGHGERQGQVPEILFDRVDGRGDESGDEGEGKGKSREGSPSSWIVGRRKRSGGSGGEEEEIGMGVLVERSENG